VICSDLTIAALYRMLIPCNLPTPEAVVVEEYLVATRSSEMLTQAWKRLLTMKLLIVVVVVAANVVVDMSIGTTRARELRLVLRCI